MDTNKLKPLKDRIEIMVSIERAIPFGGDVWQNFPLSRMVLKIVQTGLDIKSDRIIFNTNGLGQVDPSWPLYIRLSYRSIIFCLKPGEFRVSGDRITCLYPLEAMAMEERTTDRYVLPISSDISLSLKKIERSFRESSFDLEVRIVDVSECGLGIIISQANREYLRRFDHLWVHAIDQRPLDHQLFGTVCYVAPKGYYLKRGDVRVGLALDKAIAREVFEHLKKKSCLTLSA